VSNLGTFDLSVVNMEGDVFLLYEIDDILVLASIKGHISTQKVVFDIVQVELNVVSFAIVLTRPTHVRLRSEKLVGYLQIFLRFDVE